MVQFIKINNMGNLKNENINNISELYRKCGFRKSENFQKCLVYDKIEIWGRTIGKTNKLN